MKKTLFLLISTLLLANEPSAFKAGDLDSPTPYGLTQSEKKIVEQNKNIQSISRNLFDTNQTQSELRNELDGIKSLLGSIGEKQQRFSEKIDSDQNGSLKDVNTRVDALSKKLEDNFKLQNENYDKIMQMLSEMAKMIDQKKVDTNTTEQNITKPLPEQSKLTPDETFKKAEKLYKSNNLTDSKALFLQIVDTNTSKKAMTQFYLGEIEYKNTNYKASLGYYQDSINSDEKSSSVPLMLFHSAICLEKLNRKDDAKKVLDTLIKTYPSNYIIKSAKKKYSEL